MKWFLQLAAASVVAFSIGCTREPAIQTGPPSVSANGDDTVTPDGTAPSSDFTPVPKARPIDPYTAEYDPETVVTFRGQILGFRRISLSDDRTGLFVRIHSGGGLPWVYLGPEFWLSDHGLTLAMTQEVSVTGSMTQEGGQPLLIAREIRVADSRIALRDEWGTPRWALPAGVDLTGESREQDLKQRREEYLKRVLAYHEREAEAIRAKLLLEHTK